jgi:hypothetical protein
MYKTHPVFKPPAEAHIPLWRYMELSKFLALLEDQALFFARANTMADKFEGASGTAALVARSRLDRGLAAVLTQAASFNKLMTNFTYLNCWHASEYESAAMWGLYQRDGRGLAVRSTFERLTKSMQSDLFIYAGVVEYIDYESVAIPETNGYAPYMHKRMSFEHEHEVRAVIQDMSSAYEIYGNKKDVPLVPGLLIPVDLEQLVESVYVAPEAEEWFAKLVEKLVRRYGREWPVRYSDLSRDPVY